jgi:hypothetical protein
MADIDFEPCEARNFVKILKKRLPASVFELTCPAKKHRSFLYIENIRSL